MGKLTESPGLEEILEKVKPHSDVRGPVLQIPITIRIAGVEKMETYNPCLDPDLTRSYGHWGYTGQARSRL